MNLKALVCGLVAVFAAFGGTIAQVPGTKPIEFTEYTLPNGLTVILHEDHSTPIVAVTMLYHVGSKNEDPKRTGFAHFFEHLLFEGTENIDRGEFMRIVESAGGVLNANTTFDRTFYYEILPSNQLELGLWLESERLLHAKIDQIGVDTQREVVKEELRQRNENTPYGSVINEIFAHAYEVHPYRWTPGGSPEYINQAQLSEFIDFYNTFYVPQNATLSIAGDIDTEEAKKLIEKYFGGIPKGEKAIPRPKEVEPVKHKEVRDTIFDNIQLPGVIMAYHVPDQTSDDFYAVDMLATLLSRGNSSRLQKNVVDKKQKGLFAGAFPLPTEDPGVTIMFSIANMGVPPEDLEAAIQEEIDRVIDELVTDEEFQKLRNQIENDIVSGRSRVASIAESLANYKVYYGDANLINTELERYMKVTPEDIRRVAKEYFRSDNRVVLYYLPKSQEGGQQSGGHK